MFKATLKSLFAHRSRLLLSTLAIVLGIAFLSGIMTFNRMINQTFDGIIASSTPPVGISPKGMFNDNAEPVQPKKPLTKDDIAKVKAVDGVENAWGSSWRPNTYILDKQGKVVRVSMAPNLGGNYIPGKAYGDKTGLKIVDGCEPKADNEVAIDAEAMKKTGYKFGDTIDIVVAEAGKKTFTLVGSIQWGDSPSGGATYTTFTDTAMQSLFFEGKPYYETMWITPKPGVDVVELTKRINDQVSIPDYQAYDGKTMTDNLSKDMREQLGFLGTFLTVFAVIALVVGMFLIVNTFTIIVAQRSRELALFRTMGASRGQVRRSVLIEALMVSIIGSTVGILGGWGLAALLVPFVNSDGTLVSGALPPDLRTIVICMVVGIVTTIVAAYMPARKAAKVPPVVAMNGESMTGTQTLGARAIVGTGMAVLGLASLSAGLFIRQIPQPLTFVGVGAGLTLIGVAIASPLLGSPFTWLMDKLYSLLFGEVGHLAATNATRNPRRTAATASALMIGVALVTTMSILGSSVTYSMHSAFGDKLHLNAIVESAGFSGWKPEVTDRMRKVDGVDKIWSITFGQAVPTADKTKAFSVSGIDMDMFGKLVDQKLIEGRTANAVDEIMLEKDNFTKFGFKVGEQIPVRLNGMDRTLTLVGVYEDPTGVSLGNCFTSRATLNFEGQPDVDYLAFIQFKPGVDEKHVMNGLATAMQDYPMVTISTKAEFAKAGTAQIDTILTMIYALLGIAVIIAIFGVINTLVLSIIERKQEIGLLRSIGLTRHQLRFMVGLESVVIALLGAVLGMGMGLVFGIALQRSMRAEGITDLLIPWSQLGMYGVLAVIIGILAAIIPAIWGSRLKVLDAVRSE